MDYETEKELKELMNGIEDDFSELKAVIYALMDLNESDITTFIVLEIANELTREVFIRSNNCKKLLELS